MCGGNRRRAAQYGGACGAYSTYGAGCHSTRPHGGVLALIEGVQQMRLASQQRTMAASVAPITNTLPAYSQASELDAQSQGVVYDKKKQVPQEAIDFEVLPAYQEVAGLERSGVLAPEAFPVRSTEAAYMPTSVEPSQLLSRALPAGGLTEFQEALTSYRQGECGGRCRAKKAARSMVRELVSQEIARREAAHGGLKCGQRKQIRREIAPVKSMLKEAVREARRERGCC